MTNDYEDKICDLINQWTEMPDKYKHLEIFLNRSIDKPDNPDKIFLMVTPESFSKVQLLDLNYEKNCIILHLKDFQTNLAGNVRIDVNNEKQTVYFINWSDIKRLLLDEMITETIVTLMEFE